MLSVTGPAAYLGASARSLGVSLSVSLFQKSPPSPSLGAFPCLVFAPTSRQLLEHSQRTVSIGKCPGFHCPGLPRAPLRKHKSLRGVWEIPLLTRSLFSLCFLCFFRCLQPPGLCVNRVPACALDLPSPPHGVFCLLICLVSSEWCFLW